MIEQSKITAKSAGFTLIETLVVLILVTLMFVFGSIQICSMQEASAERHFWRSMRENWQQSQARAQNGGRKTTISYENQQIFFRYVTPDYTTKINRIGLPSTLHCKYFSTIEMHGNGYVKPGTEVFYSSRTKKQYSMKIQMAWGGYYVQEE